MRYAVVIEKAEQGLSAHLPDLPGCSATGATLDTVRATIREAIVFRLNGLRADGEPVPPPKTPIAPRPEESDPDVVEDPFVTFIEWADPADEEDYGDLRSEPSIRGIRARARFQLKPGASPDPLRPTRDPEPPCPSTSPS